MAAVQQPLVQQQKISFGEYDTTQTNITPNQSAKVSSDVEAALTLSPITSPTTTTSDGPHNEGT